MCVKRAAADLALPVAWNQQPSPGQRGACTGAQCALLHSHSAHQAVSLRGRSSATAGELRGAEKAP